MPSRLRRPRHDQSPRRPVRPGIEYPDATDYLALKLKRVTGGADIYVRAMDDTGTHYQACADNCDGHGGWHTVATAYGYSAIGALDKLAAKLGFTADEDGNFVRAARVEDVREVEVA